MNKYPNNPYCKRPKDSVMREYCRCIDCRRYEDETIRNTENKVRSSEVESVENWEGFDPAN